MCDVGKVHNAPKIWPLCLLVCPMGKNLPIKLVRLVNSDDSIHVGFVIAPMFLHAITTMDTSWQISFITLRYDRSTILG